MLKKSLYQPPANKWNKPNHQEQNFQKAWLSSSSCFQAKTWNFRMAFILLSHCFHTLCRYTCSARDSLIACQGEQALHQAQTMPLKLRLLSALRSFWTAEQSVSRVCLQLRQAVERAAFLAAQVVRVRARRRGLREQAVAVRAAGGSLPASGVLPRLCSFAVPPCAFPSLGNGSRNVFSHHNP